MSRWEYILLTGVNFNGVGKGLETHYPSLYRMTTNGQELITNFKNRPKGVSEVDAVAQMISQLGDEGWETMFGNLPRDDSGEGFIWFRRPKP